MSTRRPAVRRLVSERAVREAARAGRGLEITKDTIVTPAARDLARALGIVLSPRSGARSPTIPLSPPREGPREVKLAIGADHGGFTLKEFLKPVIVELGFSVADVGCWSTEPVDYPVYAARVSDQVSD